MTFEGIDGSGKTTVSRQVHELLRARGERVVLTSEPTATWLGEAVRRSYVDDVGPIAESFLFLADRARHVEEIRRLLRAGEIVLCDRYVDSTYAYQGVRLEGRVPDPMDFLRRASEPWILEPDVTILIRVTPDVGARRISDRTQRIHFEDPAFLAKVAANYETLAKAERFVVLDGNRPSPAVAEEAVMAIEKRLRASPARP